MSTIRRYLASVAGKRRESRPLYGTNCVQNFLSEGRGFGERDASYAKWRYLLQLSWQSFVVKVFSVLSPFLLLTADREIVL